jgi:hypothetical protein
MIKLKNLLVENMRRFGTKNLNEQEIKNIAFDLAMNVPLNAQNTIDTNGQATFTLSQLGPKAAEEYTGIIPMLIINGKTINSMTNQKLVGSTITGNILLNKLDPALISFLQTMIGKKELYVKDVNFRYVLVRKPDPKVPGSAVTREQGYLGNVTINSYKPQATTTPK